MGLSPFNSNSFCQCAQTKVTNVTNVTVEVPDRSGQPDPWKFQRVHSYRQGDFLVARIIYPDCTNFEGEKILVFHGVSDQEFREAVFIDPHFCKGNHISPIARFIPTQSGWDMAVIFAYTMNQNGWSPYAEESAHPTETKR